MTDFMVHSTEGRPKQRDMNKWHNKNAGVEIAVQAYTDSQNHIYCN